MSNPNNKANKTYTREQAVARLAKLRRLLGFNFGMDEEYADIKVLNAAEHYEWICTAPACEIVLHRLQMLEDSNSPDNFEADRSAEFDSLHGDNDRFYSGSGESMDDESYERYLNG